MNRLSIVDRKSQCVICRVVCKTLTINSKQCPFVVKHVFIYRYPVYTYILMSTWCDFWTYLTVCSKTSMVIVNNIYLRVNSLQYLLIVVKWTMTVAIAMTVPHRFVWGIGYWITISQNFVVLSQSNSSLCHEGDKLPACLNCWSILRILIYKVSTK